MPDKHEVGGSSPLEPTRTSLREVPQFASKLLDSEDDEVQRYYVH